MSRRLAVPKRQNYSSNGPGGTVFDQSFIMHTPFGVPPRLEFKTITASVRPHRVAVLVDRSDPEWTYTISRIIGWASQAWGGRHFLIVPTDGESIAPVFWSILEAYDPDIVHAYQKTFLDLRFSQPEKHRAQVDLEVDHFLKQSPTDNMIDVRQEIEKALNQTPVSHFSISEALQNQLKRRLVPFYFERHTVEFIRADSAPSYPLTSWSSLLPTCSHPGGVTSFTVPGDDYMRILVASITGSLPDSVLKDLTESGLEHTVFDFATDDTRAIADLIFPGSLSPTAPPDPYVQTPFANSMLQLSYYRMRTYQSWRAPVYVVLGNQLEDFCLFYDLERLTADVIWVPERWLASPTPAPNTPDAVPRAMISWIVNSVYLKTRFHRQGSPIIVTSASKSLADQKHLFNRTTQLNFLGTDMQEHLRASAAFAGEIPTNLEDVRIVYETANAGVTSVEPFLDGTTGGYFRTPKPKNFTSPHPNDHRWITEIEIQGHIAPRRDGIGEKVVLLGNYGSLHIRAGKYGVGYFCPNVFYFGGDIDSILVRPKLAALDELQLFGHVFGRADFWIRLSDKGNFARDFISKFGSLEDAAVFLRDRPSRSVLEKFLDKTPNKGGVVDQGVLLKDDRRYLDFQAMQKLTGEESRSVELIDHLTRRTVFHRGFIFKCDRCRNAEWYDVEEVGQSFECKRCSQQQVIQLQHWRQPSEPRWYFKLDEVAYHALNGGVVATILSLEALRRKTRDTFLFIPEFELRRSPDNQKPDMELDFACNRDGKLILGEARSGGRLGGSAAEEENKLGHYKEAAAAILADQLTFGTTDDTWQESTVNRAKQALEGTGIELKFLSSADLIA